MAQQQNHDPMEEIIAEGRIHTRPVRRYEIPEILTVDLDFMFELLIGVLENVYLNDLNVINRYAGEELIRKDIRALLHMLMGVTYNRLRAQFVKHAPNARDARMQQRCPVSNSLLFPTWLSSTLGAIGPCRIMDGPTDKMVLWATPSANMQRYGREEHHALDEGGYARLIYVLAACNYQLSPMDFNTQGSFFPTIETEFLEHNWTAYGTVHQSHYENEDIIRILAMSDRHGNTPFGKIGMTIGYVDDQNFMTALAAAGRPEGIPATENPTSQGRLVGAHFEVNYFGIRPAREASEGVEARNAECYIIGRGVKRYYQVALASQICTTEVSQMLRHHLTR